MSVNTLRATLLPDGTIHLIDPLPADFEEAQEVMIVLGMPVSTNVFGAPVVVDEHDGIEMPIQPPDETALDDFIGLWADRRDEIPDSAAYVRQLRQTAQRKTPPWPDQR